MLLLLQGTSASATDETVVRYSSQYDQKLDPFTSFSKRERLRKYMDLRPYDKITLGMVSDGVVFCKLCTVEMPSLGDNVHNAVCCD